MFDVPSIRLGKIFGIPVEVDLSWLVIFGLVTFSLGSSYFPRIPGATGAPAVLHYVVGAVTSLLFFASILAHELCHSLVARAEGGHVERITLFIFGGVAQIDEEPKTPGREFLMAAAGPAMSLVLAAALFLAYAVATAQGAPWFVSAPLQYLSLINMFVAVFNLLPGFPLDGGRVLRSILWGITGDAMKATRWAVRSGQFIGWSMVVLAVYSVLQGSADLIWFGLVGWFIATLASQALQQQVVKSTLEGVTARDIMSSEPEYVEGSSTLDVLVNEHFIGRRHSRYPVFYDGAIVGLITLPDVKRVEMSEWPFVKTIDVTNRGLDALVVKADTPVDTVLGRLAGDRPGALLVVDQGRLVGVITRSDVISRLEEALS
ncbi:MAG TPA: site-2 protease family protein [Coriobacteriia bacterium]|nr:site-2 protease family protein [Coriobacteriia bacterium]